MKRTAIIALLVLISGILFANKGFLEVRTDLPGVDVYLDGQFVGKTVTFENVNILSISGKNPGKYVLLCTHAGYKDDKRNVNIPAEGSERVIVNLLQRDIKSVPLTQDVKGALVKDTGVLIVRSRPTGASVILNDIELLTKTDARVDELNAGKYNIKCVFGTKELRGNFVLAPQDTVRVMVDFFDNTIEFDLRYRVTLATDPESKVYMNGKVLGTGTQTLNLKKGRYAFRFEASGYKVLDKEIEISSSDLFIYELQKIIPGTLEVSAEKSSIYIGSRLIGYEKVNTDLEPGTYTVTAKLSNHDDASSTVIIEGNRTTKLNLTPLPSMGKITIQLVDSRDKINVRAYKTLINKQEKSQQPASAGVSRKVESTGNATIDQFFDDIAKIDTQVKAIDDKLTGLQCYLIMLALEPELLLKESAGASFNQLVDFSREHLAGKNDFTININKEALDKLSGASFLPLLANLQGLAQEIRSIETDVKEIEKQVKSISSTAQKMPEEAKKLSPMKIPAVIGKITSTIRQLQDLAANVSSIINKIPTTLEISTALISKQEKQISLKTKNTAQAVDTIEIKVIQGIPLVINNNSTKFVSGQAVSLPLGAYQLNIDSKTYLLRDKTKQFSISKGKNADAIYIIDDINHLKSSQRFWKTNTWVALSLSALSVGAIAFFDYQAGNYIDDYDQAPNSMERRDAWENSEQAIDRRNMAIYISIAPIAYTVISSINQSSYGRKLK